MLQNNSIIKVLSITDDSGFVALVNTHDYKSFISKDWTFLELKQRFIDEMNANHLILWSSGLEGKWQIFFLHYASENLSYREIEKSIYVTNGHLSIVNYEDITMAAQFEDIKLPLAHSSNLTVVMENGLYNILVRQMFNPDGFVEQSGNADFEIICKKVEVFNSQINIVEKVFWLNE